MHLPTNASKMVSVLLSTYTSHSFRNSQLPWTIAGLLLLMIVPQVSSQCTICESPYTGFATDLFPDDIKTCPKCVKLLSEEVDSMHKWMTYRKENAKSLVKELKDLKVTVAHIMEKSKEFKDNISSIVILNAGFTGSTGESGARGSPGITGYVGATGHTGAVGIVGQPGYTGAHGATGVPNNIPGPPGDTGYTGDTGASGLPGFSTGSSVIGATGATGLPGATGAFGRIGITGGYHVGLTGVPGRTGSSGIVGTFGQTGSQGFTGLIGLTGVDGLPGEFGSSGRVLFEPEDIPLKDHQLLFPFSESVEERWIKFRSEYERIVYSDDDCSVCVSSFTTDIVQSLYRMSEQMLKDEPTISRLIYERYRILRLLAILKKSINYSEPKFSASPGPAVPEILTCVFDIVFVVDLSGSVSGRSLSGVSNIELIRQFLRLSIQPPILLGTDRDRAGLVVYQSSSRTLHTLTDDQTIEFFTSNGIEGIPNPSGGTNLLAGLEGALAVLAARRSNAKPVVILITDGVGTSSQVNSSIQNLTQIGATRIAIGVTDSINQETLKNYATSENHIKFLQSFDDLTRIRPSVINSIITQCNRTEIADFQGAVPRGPTGATGEAGATGYRGRAGSNGATGATGTQGLTGSQGSTGAVGFTGVTGQSNKGPTGAKGYTGNTGPEGATGASSNNIGPPGSTGADGQTGAAGPGGSRGSDGLLGNTGATGYIGSSGRTGATGVTGSFGSTGARGQAGATGEAGDTGDPGENVVIKTRYR